MWKKLAKLTLLTFLGILLLQTGITVLAQPKPSNRPAQTRPAPPPAAKPASPYDKAKSELSTNAYTGYRIVERLARANKIDATPWRLTIVPEYNVNAFATEVNLLAVYTGLIDQLQGDVAAIAFVMGHEMAHHTQRHLAIGPAQKEQLIAKIQKEAEEEVRKEVESANNEATGARVGGAILQTIGGFFGGLGSLGGQVGGAAAELSAQQRLEQAKKRIPEIVQEKTRELEQKIAQDSRAFEFEADEVGYKYFATAGFEPEGALRAMTVLGRIPGSELDTTHLAIPKRIEKLEASMQEYPAATLASQGKLRLDTTKPLTYAPSEDGKSLRINSVHGSTAVDPFERQFGQ
jgi:hypothetical protein